MDKLKSTNLSRQQIHELAEMFAEKTSYKPGETDIIEYVNNQLHGEIQYTDSPKDSVGGSISVRGKNDFTIYLSKATSHIRDVFTIAHELGHYFLHSKLGQIQINANRSDDIDETEREANSFAAAFLMPEERVRELFAEKDGDISALANAFKVSLTAMDWRCVNLGLKKTIND